jgi:orotidine-5'-phosphate decarboxylase
MNFIEKCEERFSIVNSVLCAGFDPVLEKLPVKKDSISETLSDYFIEIMNNFGKYIFAVKPNMAFYEQYGIEGYIGLKKIINEAKKIKIPVILDAKRGDIGNTSAAYAKAAFNELEADAITLSPYLGEDSLSPFFEYKDRGFFILDRTSNKGSSDIQLLKLENGEYLYTEVSKKIAEWNKKYCEGIGAVAGATHPDELKKIASYFCDNNCPPLLIPGVGVQGGDLQTVIKILTGMNYPLHKIFVNSSSKIIFAHNEHKELNYLDAIEIEIKKMQINDF